jgi:D-aminoacyl-tRNA deacylase
MKLAIQRVKKAKVGVNNNIVGQIEAGLFVLLGVGKEDSGKEVNTLVEKLINLRIMDDNDGKMNLSIVNTKGEILIVSQFTLYADTKKGNRPSFVDAASSKQAKELYELFIEKVKEKGLRVETGEFGSNMQIETICDGPVTILLESSIDKSSRKN